MKFYKLYAKKTKNTQEIASGFALACEAARPADEVWNMAVYGKSQIGKSEFSRAFAGAALQNANDTAEAHTEKMHDFTSAASRTQIRIGDYASNRGPNEETEPAFTLSRQEGYGGYDMLEHAPADYPETVRIIMGHAARGREIIMHVEDSLANTPAFQQFTQKFGAKELNF